MKFTIFWGILFFVLVMVGTVDAQIQHEVFLANTDHELHVYRILGDEPGKTIMIIGGIQGDEPSGYITADLYADIHLQKGNLIVVPRANFYSILLNKREGESGDMNRKFHDDEKEAARHNLEDGIVAILKHLIAESDCLLNLHEGSGFYNPVWLNSQENPYRYGQSIIFDAQEYTPGRNGPTIQLADIAAKVVNRVNSQISEDRYHFRPNNHDTLSDQTIHKEQRVSATYYALTRAHIPAFGIETSKSIQSLERKIWMHKLVINAMMEEFGIVFDTPGIMVEKPKLDYLLVSINQNYPFALPHGAELDLEVGDDVLVTGILANYPRGLVADIEDYGTTNDTHRPYRFSEKTRIYVRKDAHICGWVDLIPKLSEEEQGGPETNVVQVGQLRVEEELPQLMAETLIIDVNGELHSLGNKESITVARDSRLMLQAVRSNVATADNDIRVNFKGYAPPKSVNDGNDLHFLINTAKDLLPRYSEDAAGKRYPIVATYDEKVVGMFWIELDG